jgi:hypothetical protein
MRRYIILVAAILVYGLLPGVLHAMDSGQPALNAHAAEGFCASRACGSK